MKSYSVEFRKEVLDFCGKHSVRKAAKMFHISTDTITNWKTLLKEIGSLEKRKIVRKDRKLDLEKLKELLDSKPDMLQRELAEHFKVSRFLGLGLKSLVTNVKKNDFI